MTERPRNLDDSALLELVQRQTFRYFWDFGHPVSGLSRERNNGGPDEVTSGGSGFGVMAIMVAVERGWISARRRPRAADDDAQVPRQGRQLSRRLPAFLERRDRPDHSRSRARTMAATSSRRRF